MGWRKKVFRIVFCTIAALPLFVATYFFFAWLLAKIPVNTDFKQAENGVEIYIKSNGVHTDIIVPTKTEYMDWTTQLKPEDFKQTALNYIAFGWGDKGFYLNTPTWADLTFSTAFKAMFWLSSSAMHVTYYSNAPQKSELVRTIKISAEEYQKLVEYINASFQQDANHQYVLIRGYHYDGVNDNFYEAMGTYNLFKTCNGWTNKGLKVSGIRTCLWTPFDWGILNSIKEK